MFAVMGKQERRGPASRWLTLIPASSSRIGSVTKWVERIEMLSRSRTPAMSSFAKTPAGESPWEMETGAFKLVNNLDQAGMLGVLTKSSFRSSDEKIRRIKPM